MDNIEISDRKYWKELNYYDGLLYCSLLEIDGKNDWRMVKSESEEESITDLDITDLSVGIWYLTDEHDHVQSFKASKIYWVIPVRDI